MHRHGWTNPVQIAKVTLASHRPTPSSVQKIQTSNSFALPTADSFARRRSCIRSTRHIRDGQGTRPPVAPPPRSATRQWAAGHLAPSRSRPANARPLPVRQMPSWRVPTTLQSAKPCFPGLVLAASCSPWCGDRWSFRSHREPGQDPPSLGRPATSRGGPASLVVALARWRGAPREAQATRPSEPLVHPAAQRQPRCSLRMTRRPIPTELQRPAA